MAKLNNRIFTLTGSGGQPVLASLTRKFNQKVEKYDKEMLRRMTVATGLIWRTAHAKRPYITKSEMKAQGRSYRVSIPDPSATIPGVPVAINGGGRLQASVKQKVFRTLGMMSFEGQVSAGGGAAGYAYYLEYGTEKMPARPFMRPAISLNKDAIKRTFGIRISSNL